MKTIEDWKARAEQIIPRIGTASLGGAFLGQGMETAKTLVAAELQSAYEEGFRAGEAKRASRKRKSP